MEHATTPSLFAVGLTADTSSGPSFRWGLVSSFFLHALVITMALLIKFQSEKAQPFRTIDVALISVASLSTTAPKPQPSPAQREIKTPTEKISPPTATTVPPVEEAALPPLPTETATERLSESLGGAIHSIIVPQKQVPNSPTTPAPEPEIRPAEDHAPLFDSLQLPPSPPTIARPKPLQPAEPLKSLSPSISPSQTKPSPNTLDPVQMPDPPSSSSPAPDIRPNIKPAPAIPSLREVTPFTKPETSSVKPKTQNTPNIEESLKRNMPKIQTAPPKPTLPELSRRPPTPDLQKTPEIPKPQISTPAQPKMTDTVKKLMEGLKSTTRKPVLPLPETTRPATISSITPPPSALDQQIAKLSIPEVAPVESIKQRLQLLEVQAGSEGGGATSKTSSGKNRYLAMVEDRIDSHWVAPPLLASNPLVVLKFHIARTGEISRIQISESSGHAHYDSAAQRAVQAVNPLPPFPSDISESFFEVQYRFIKD